LVEQVARMSGNMQPPEEIKHPDAGSLIGPCLLVKVLEASRVELPVAAHS
jgi:hypothetical protein